MEHAKYQSTWKDVRAKNQTKIDSWQSYISAPRGTFYSFHSSLTTEFYWNGHKIWINHHICNIFTKSFSMRFLCEVRPGHREQHCHLTLTVWTKCKVIISHEIVSQCHSCADHLTMTWPYEQRSQVLILTCRLHSGHDNNHSLCSAASAALISPTVVWGFCMWHVIFPGQPLIALQLLSHMNGRIEKHILAELTNILISEQCVATMEQE